MLSEKLKQTDETLIELLRDRLSLLEASEPGALEEELTYVAPLLAKAGVPNAVWANMVSSCNTRISAVNPTLATDNVTPKNITIIGGRGRMGRFFTQQLTSVSHNVSVLENEDWEYADKLLSSADLVMVSVPIQWTIEVIERAAKYLAPTTALCDITSLKTEQVAAMLKHHHGPVMGLHPMFGPNVNSFAGQKVVVCPGRNNQTFQWLLEFIRTRGGEVIVSTPEEHDRMMVIIQATRHFSRFSVGVFLAQEEIDIDRSLSMSSPSYRQEIDIIKRLFAQNPNLCMDIMLASPDRCQTIVRLADTYNRIAKLVVRGDREALIEEFEAAQSFFSEENKTSSNQSNSYHKRRENPPLVRNTRKDAPKPLTIDG
ncbi:MAG: bifunctional chorismate mutase/prephenate dehydrogenase [Scytonema sp. PMC 1069.18]|nr:bifunctional chorismate mutase/prephenate dehydrogenase [Scytonema sp. PMC 1069.18]MEC4887931.1 bifunctional chorismate mutase/prephenate dehydrogenase [Scytonema sp. PMC 1070.18]